MGNNTMIQFFEWHLPNTGKHWNLLKSKVEEFKELGITGIWIPPPTKGSSDNDVGYGIYDLWDLGEFDQKGTVRTKYGTKEELISAVTALKENGIQVYADLVLNHKLGADDTELFKAELVDEEDRNKVISEPHDIKGWTKFEFKNRNNKYSDFKWNFNHFTGTDYNQENEQKGIYRILGENKDWANRVDKEKGNYDYLMGADIDHDHPDVRKDLLNFCNWIVDTLDLSGFRLDALKHIDAKFIKDMLNEVRKKNDNFFVVGEYWKDSLEEASKYIDFHQGQLSLFDVPLHFNFMEASKDGKGYDISKIFEGTLAQVNPINAVTFVDNHDSQPGESLESWVEDWFKPHAYSLILLRQDGYPCIFYGDLYEISGDNPIEGKFDIISKLLKARKNYAYGEQNDYFDHHDTIGWVRQGDDEHPQGLATVLCSSDKGSKRMFVGEHKKGQKWVDLMGFCNQEVTIDEEGWGEFYAEGGSIAVYTVKE